MKTIKAVAFLLLFALWLCAAGRAADELAAATVKAPPQGTVEREDLLRVTVHQHEKVVLVELGIEMECDLTKLVSKYGDISSKNPDGFKALLKMIGEKLAERGKAMLEKQYKENVKE